jgi:RimJ/RimL family protein N-acetyltransferase
MASFIDALKHKSFGLFRIRIVRFKRCMKYRELILRLRRFRDLPVLYSLLTPEILLEASGIEPPAFGSLFFFWIWLKTAFHIVYVIEVEEMGNRRIIGFAGLYDMNIGQSLWLSLAVFNPKDRRRGYGKQTVGLLLECLQKNSAARTVFVEILRTNVASLRFFRKLGFEICKGYKDRFFLEKS